jgi:hypothetical protein
MTKYTLIAVWAVLSVIVAIAGRPKRIGFWGALLISVLLSPIIGFIIVSLSQRKGKEDSSEKFRVQTKPPLKED